MRIIRECTQQVKKIGSGRFSNSCYSLLLTRRIGISDDRIEAIWRQIIDVFRGGILADWFAIAFTVVLYTNIHYSSVVDSFSLEIQEAEENFDLALIGALEIDIIPQLGDLRIPDPLVAQLAKVLRQGSRLHDSDVACDELHDFETVDMSEYSIGSTASGVTLPRERFSYWCFDLLFLICSDTAKGKLKVIFS